MDKKKNLLIIVDFQNTFADESLGDDENDKLNKRIEKRIEEYLNDDNDIAFTLDEAGDGDEKKLYGDIGNYIKKAVATFHKTTYGSLDLGNWIADKNYEKVEICGLVSNMCVLSNAVIVQAASQNSEIIIDSSMTACDDNKQGKNALDIMRGLKMTVV